MLGVELRRLAESTVLSQPGMEEVDELPITIEITLVAEVFNLNATPVNPVHMHQRVVSFDFLFPHCPHVVFVAL
jgi:hypothetical protein